MLWGLDQETRPLQIQSLREYIPCPEREKCKVIYQTCHTYTSPHHMYVNQFITPSALLMDKLYLSVKYFELNKEGGGVLNIISITCQSSPVGSRVHPDPDTPGHPEGQRRACRAQPAFKSLIHLCWNANHGPVVSSTLLVLECLCKQPSAVVTLCTNVQLHGWSESPTVLQRRKPLFLCGSLGLVPQKLSKGSIKELRFAKIAQETVTISSGGVLDTGVLCPGTLGSLLLDSCHQSSLTAFHRDWFLHYPSPHKEKGGVSQLV